MRNRWLWIVLAILLVILLGLGVNAAFTAAAYRQANLNTGELSPAPQTCSQCAEGITPQPRQPGYTFPYGPNNMHGRMYYSPFYLGGYLFLFPLRLILRLIALVLVIWLIVTLVNRTSHQHQNPPSDNTPMPPAAPPADVTQAQTPPTPPEEKKPEDHQP